MLEGQVFANFYGTFPSFPFAYVRDENQLSLSTVTHPAYQGSQEWANKGFPFCEIATAAEDLDRPWAQQMYSGPIHEDRNATSKWGLPLHNFVIEGASRDSLSTWSPRLEVYATYVDKLMNVFDVNLVASNAADEIHKSQLMVVL